MLILNHDQKWLDHCWWTWLDPRLPCQSLDHLCTIMFPSALVYLSLPYLHPLQDFLSLLCLHSALGSQSLHRSLSHLLAGDSVPSSHLCCCHYSCLPSSPMSPCLPLTPLLPFSPCCPGCPAGPLSPLVPLSPGRPTPPFITEEENQSHHTH